MKPDASTSNESAVPAWRVRSAPPAATRLSCAEPPGGIGINEQEQAYLAVLPTAASYRLDGELGYASGAIVTDVIDGYGAAAAGLRPFKVRATQRGGFRSHDVPPAACVRP